MVWLTVRDPAVEVALAAVMEHARMAHETTQKNLAIRIATAMAGKEVT